MEKMVKRREKGERKLARSGTKPSERDLREQAGVRHKKERRVIREKATVGSKKHGNALSWVMI